MGKLWVTSQKLVKCFNLQKEKTFVKQNNNFHVQKSFLPVEIGGPSVISNTKITPIQGKV